MVRELDGLKEQRVAGGEWTETAKNARKAISFIRSLQIDRPRLVQVCVKCEHEVMM